MINEDIDPDVAFVLLHVGDRKVDDADDQHLAKRVDPGNRTVEKVAKAHVHRRQAHHEYDDGCRDPVEKSLDLTLDHLEPGDDQRDPLYVSERTGPEKIGRAHV